MKLLIITQKVDQNDGVLGFFHQWLIEFAQYCEDVTVICLEQGMHQLPSNVKVLSLGKEVGVSRMRYLLRFYLYIWNERKNYDAVFVHMAPIYAILGGLFWRLKSKKISMWYTHRHVDFKLRLATMFVHRVFTAAPESFRLPTPKLLVTGHGIDLSLFPFQEKTIDASAITLLHVGRITPIKNCHVLVAAAARVREKIPSVKLLFVGEPRSPQDEKYKLQLQSQIKNLGLEQNVDFCGSITYDLLHNYYQRASFSVNLTPTGGIDKAVLESMASGVPVFASNQAFKSYFGDDAKHLLFNFDDSDDLASKMLQATDPALYLGLSKRLNKIARERAGLDSIIKKIIQAV